MNMDKVVGTKGSDPFAWRLDRQVKWPEPHEDQKSELRPTQISKSLNGLDISSGFQRSNCVLYAVLGGS